MPSTLRRLFREHARPRLALALAPFDLRDASGRLIGRIDRMQLRGGALEAEGWALAPRVGFAGPGGGVAAPDFPRPDVAAALGLAPDAAVGFVARLAGWEHGAHFVVETAGTRHVYALPPVPRAGLRRAQVALVPGFVGACLRGLPDLARWRLAGDTEARARLRGRIIGGGGPAALAPPEGPAPLPEGLFTDPPPPPAPPATRVTIVMPVYNALALLREALGRIVAHTDLDWHLVLIEDRSTDPELRPWLRSWAASQPAGRVTLLENEANLGFIGSVNRGFAVALARGDHVVLLNSDALVPAGWAGRLLGPILAQDRVASVTPMSNDAEIFNVPVICARADLRRGEADALDAAAARLGGLALLPEVPTGVGFCMAMNIRALAEGPAFDTAFGRGYGEEVDWCRARLMQGWRHLGHGGVFVEHRGGQSFGSEAKLALVRENNARVAARHPGYDAEVQGFIRRDPVLGPRLALGLALAGLRAGEAQVPVYLGHALGGGAALWLDRQIADDVAAQGVAVELRVGGPLRWRIRLHGPAGVTEGDTDETPLMLALLEGLPRRRVVYSCGVGDRDPVTLPDVLLRLAEGRAHRLEVLFHDYFPVAPAFTLLGADGLFRGVPADDSDDPAHAALRPDGTRVPLAEWRAAWGRLLRRADGLRVFSAASQAHVAAAYPDLAPRLELRPHRPIHDVPAIAPGRAHDGRPVIGVLGDIGYQKGAAVLAEAARRLAAGRGARLVVIGRVDPAHPLVPPAQVHGGYSPDELPALVARYGIGAWWIPSIWPETFSFTTREALATGLPVWAFALGAQGEAVAEAVAQGAPGGVIPLDGGRPDIARTLDAIVNSIDGSRA